MNYVNKDNTFQRPDGGKYGSVINKIAKDGICPFCPEHLSTVHPNPILLDGHKWLVTDNAYPYANTDQHLLFIHKEHVEDMNELTPKEWKELYELVLSMINMRKIAGAAFVMRFGKTALTGASVSHLHAMLVSGTGDPEMPPVLMRVG